MEQFEPIQVHVPSVNAELVEVTDQNKDEILNNLHELVDECQVLIRRINNPEDYRDPNA